MYNNNRMAANYFSLFYFEYFEIEMRARDIITLDGFDLILCSIDTEMFQHNQFDSI